MTSHTFLVRLRCVALLAALACVLLARVSVPAGWMPVARDGSVVLAPCSGMGVAHVMPGMAMHGAEKQQRHPDPGGDHPCAGAGVSVAVAVGLGLAAPPPPQTGPPIAV